MASPTNPTWYDVLGVSRDASPEEIKAAWRDATDKFEPGSGSGGQFRMFNEAADVLLDPARRRAYDDSLGASAATETALPPSSGEGAVDREAGQQEIDQAEVDQAEVDEAEVDQAEVDQEPTAEVHPPAEPVSGPERPRRRRRSKASTQKAAPPSAPASWLAVIVAVVLTLITVGALVAVVVLGQQVREDARIADARDEAPSAAERAAKAVFEYDYRQLPADRKRALPYLTGPYKKEYLKTISLLEKQKDGTPGLAVQTKTVLTASVLGSGVVDADEDSARVLVYVNLVSNKAGKEPQIFQNRVAMRMDKEGDRWKLAKVDTY